MSNAEELDISIVSFLETLKKTVTKEFKYVKSEDNDWTEIKSLKDRVSMHDLHFLLTDRNVKHAAKLHALAIQKDSTEAKEVKSMLKTLISFSELYESRYEKYVGNQDFDALLLEMSSSKSVAKAEIEFQSDITKNVTGLNETIRKIRKIEDKSSVEIPVFQDLPVPFLMSKMVEERYPEVKALRESKLKK